MDKQMENNIHIVVARIEERLKNIQKQIDQFIRSSNDDKQNMKNYIDDKFITKDEFAPIKRLHNKFIDFSVGLIIFLGGAVLALAYYIQKKIGL